MVASQGGAPPLGALSHAVREAAFDNLRINHGQNPSKPECSLSADLPQQIARQTLEPLKKYGYPSDSLHVVRDLPAVAPPESRALFEDMAAVVNSHITPNRREVNAYGGDDRSAIYHNQGARRYNSAAVLAGLTVAASLPDKIDAPGMYRLLDEVTSKATYQPYARVYDHDNRMPADHAAECAIEVVTAVGRHCEFEPLAKLMASGASADVKKSTMEQMRSMWAS